MATEKRRGQCEGCNNSPRVLTQIESGQWVCQTCLREIRGPKVNFVCAEAVAGLRRKGFSVPDKLTREEYRRLMDEYTRAWQLSEIRSAGKTVADDISSQEVERLWRIMRLQARGAEIEDLATLDEICTLELLRHFSTKVVGVTHWNRDGTSRQEIISRCRQWEPLRFVPEPDNPADENAIAVVRANGEQLGYLSAGIAEIVTDVMGRGWQYFPFIKAILEDGIASHSYGVVLVYVAADPSLPADVVQAYTEKVLTRAGRKH